MPRRDTIIVENFLSDFVLELSKKHGKDIDFILLFGSAARREFKAGASDLDLIIAVKDDRGVEPVTRCAESIFWKLDRKHKTRLKEVCSTSRTDIFGSVEKEVKLYQPFEVIGPSDVRFEEGSIFLRSLGAFAVIAPLAQFAKKIKREGRILYGRDVISTMKVPDSFFDKVKSFFIPYSLAIVAAVISPFVPNKALNYSIKAVLYSIDSQLFIMDAKTSDKTPLNLLILRYELGEMSSIRLAREALAAKSNLEKTKKEWSYSDKVSFSLQAPLFIFYNNLASLFRAIQRLF